MHKHKSPNQHNPTQKISQKKKKTQKPQKFSKTQNLGLKCMNACKWRDSEHLPRD